MAVMQESASSNRRTGGLVNEITNQILSDERRDREFQVPVAPQVVWVKYIRQFLTHGCNFFAYLCVIRLNTLFLVFMDHGWGARTGR